MLHRSLLVFAVACGSSSTPAHSPASTTTAIAEGDRYEVPSGDLEAAIAGPHRTAQERARDRYRKPAETLRYFGVTPEQVVLEIWPGRGWYTRILAPYLRGGPGKLIVATFDPDDDSFQGRITREFQAMLAAHPELYDRVEQAVLFRDRRLDDVPDGSVDVALSFRNTHNWIRWEGHDADAYFAAVARVLKPGGRFGIIQHRAPEEAEHGEDGTLGYVTESWVIAHARGAGLELVERSELHANPRDTHQHPEGVWSLPPTLRGGDETLRQVGESDRMTLTFRKPEPIDEAPEAS